MTDEPKRIINTYEQLTRAVEEKLIRGMVLVYGTLLLMSGVAAVASYSVVGPTQLTKLSVPHAPTTPRASAASSRPRLRHAAATRF